MSHTRRDRILSLLPSHPSRILDIGCAQGRLGAHAKERGHAVFGVDISPRAVEAARNVLDGAWVCDIEKEWPREVIGQPFDGIIASEVIEHLFDPKPFLRQCHSALRNDGFIILTTPNFLTWTNRIRFMFGFFEYQDQGMFDFGHIRWFTYASLQRALRDVGFTIEKERHILFPGKLAFVARFFPSFFAFQFIVRARKISP
ncbi:MAG: class I SAM-dependent methyltransferase [Candidatus Paceibacterota bacterium]|nr:MAG: class I SAM-dependent methyltransferase [Candidatus Paceibacterota bacterium]